MINYFELSRALFAIAAFILLCVVWFELSDSYHEKVNRLNLNKMLRHKKIEGIIYGATITVLLFAVAGMYIFTPEVVITYLGDLISATINKTQV